MDEFLDEASLQQLLVGDGRRPIAKWLDMDITSPSCGSSEIIVKEAACAGPAPFPIHVRKAGSWLSKQIDGDANAVQRRLAHHCRPGAASDRASEVLREAEQLSANASVPEGRPADLVSFLLPSLAPKAWQPSEEPKQLARLLRRQRLNPVLRCQSLRDIDVATFVDSVPVAFVLDNDRMLVHEVSHDTNLSGGLTAEFALCSYVLARDGWLVIHLRPGAVARLEAATKRGEPVSLQTYIRKIAKSWSDPLRITV